MKHALIDLAYTFAINYNNKLNAKINMWKIAIKISFKEIKPKMSKYYLSNFTNLCKSRDSSISNIIFSLSLSRRLVNYIIEHLRSYRFILPRFVPPLRAISRVFEREFKGKSIALAVKTSP